MIKCIWILAFLCLPLFSSGRDNLAVLKNDIERIIHHADSQASVGVDVISMHNHQRLYSKNHKQRFIPASITKLLTLGAAFDLLGANYTYKTGIFTDGKVENGVLYGNLYVKGSGDPTLGTGDLENLVKNLHLMGISEVKGSVVVDASAFDSTPFAAGWMVEDTAFISSALPSALSINQSCFDIWIRPGAQEASPAIVLSDLLHIELPFLIDNQTHTISNVQESHLVEVTTDCTSKESVVRIAGNMSLQGAPQHKRVPIKEPALMAGVIVKDMMKRYEIVFKGAVHEGVTPVDAAVLSEHTSESLLSIGQKMCKESDNFFAHCLFKTLGKEVQGPPGSWQSGSKALREFLTGKVHIDASEIVLLDGSGLSRYNLISPQQMVAFLSWAGSNVVCGSEFKAALSIAGIDGTLKNRCQNLRGKLRGKTGTMTGVSSLCGYLFTQDGEELAFTIIVNGTTKPPQEIREKLIDPICVTLGNFTRR